LEQTKEEKAVWGALGEHEMKVEYFKEWRNSFKKPSYPYLRLSLSMREMREMTTMMLLELEEGLRVAGARH
jgi:hypothetical protein